MRLHGLGLLFVLLTAGCGDGDDAGSGSPGGGRSGRLFEYAPPGQLGKFPVGFVTMPFVDESRPELATVDAADNRTLPSVVWFPASEASRAEPKATFRDFFTPALAAALGALAPPGFLDTASNSVKGAQLGGDGPYPLIVFSHGNGGLGVQSFFLTEYLASHGYVVVCPDHTGNALMTELPNGLVVRTNGEDGTYGATALDDRVADASFLVDNMTELNTSDPEARFTGKVDLDNVGLTGHSFGGLTTLRGMEGDLRFDAGAPMAPASPDTSNINRPVMFFIATEDGTLSDGNAKTETNYQSLSGPKMLLSIIDAGHFSFSNGCPLGIGAEDGCGTGTRANGETFTFLLDTRVHEITNYYQTALFGYYLKRVTGYSKDLLAEPFSKDVTIERSGMP